MRRQPPAPEIRVTAPLGLGSTCPSRPAETVASRDAATHRAFAWHLAALAPPPAPPPSDGPEPRRAFVWHLAALSALLLLIVACDGGGGGGGDRDGGAPDACVGDCGCDAACGDGFVCADGQCRPTCALGSDGCSCDGDRCDEGLVCGDGLCGPMECPAGADGCACDAGACAEGLACVGGVCRTPDCPAGTLGCRCNRGSCSGGARCEAGTLTCVEPEPCTPGNQGCRCDDAGGCVAGLECEGDVCRAPDCPAGLEGCACLDGQCGRTPDGAAMTCEGGVCRRPGCAPGTRGCACVAGATCLSSDDACLDGFCAARACIPGTDGCGCLAGSCNPGLACRGGTVCVDNAGQEGGPCLPGGTCARNARCDRSSEPAACVYCDLGSLGCQCRDDGACGPGLDCVGGLCVGDDSVHRREPPAAPRCYTPCRADLSPDLAGRCDADGLLEGCLAGQACVEGSCVAAGEGPPACRTDGDCPEFQMCARGRCYAECQQDADCAAGFGCHRKVCRLPCTLSRATCPEGQLCEALDGENGFCNTAPRSADPAAPAPSGRFELERRVLEFSNTRLEHRIQLRNDGPEAVTFTIRKVEHSAKLRDGGADVRRPARRDDECVGAECPLWWLEFGEFGHLTRGGEATIRAAGNCGLDCPYLTVRVGDGGLEATRWRGEIEVTSPLGSDRVTLSYVESPAGRWAGNLYYYATFPTAGIDGVPGRDGWLQREDRGDVEGVRNGLIQRWSAFRTGSLNGGWAEMKAVLTATETGQWRFPNVTEDCLAREGACYLFDNGAGSLPRVYVTALLDTPIPTGATAFPVEMNLHQPDDPRTLTGRVVSTTTLHMPGDPAVRVELASDATDPRECDPRIRTNCVHFVSGLDLQIVQGGRYRAEPGGRCAAPFVARTQPWLVPGFLDGARRDVPTGLFRTDECVDSRLPWFTEPTEAQTAANLNLAAGNPIPDGRFSRRRIELLDGALVDQQELFVLFRERSPSFLGDGQDLEAYGYMLLRRVPAEIAETDEDADGVPDAYAGTAPPADLPQAPSQLGVTCDPSLLEDILGRGQRLTADNAYRVVGAILDGASADDAVPLATGGVEEVHYLCVDTGLFDGGAGNNARWGTGAIGPNDDSCPTAANSRCEDGLSGSVDGSCGNGRDATDCGFRYNDVRQACPVGSDVVFFTVDARVLGALHAHPCQADASCGAQLQTWIDSGFPGVLQVNPAWRCVDENLLYCDRNRLDLRDGKVFYPAASEGVFDVPLEPGIADAFRYRSRFQSEGGAVVGFAPTVCQPLSDAVPYCYDPARIQELQGRIDCLLSVYQQYYAGADGPGRPGSQRLYRWLEESFSVREDAEPLGGPPRRTPGFERQFAELAIMLGDDAYTAAFESRFDQAGLRAAAFEGSLFEADGIDLSGVAGYEMYQLYQAVQYYGLVLDRFYDMGPVLATSLAAGPPQSDRNFVSAEMVTTWFDRVARASTQKSRALAEIARRSQSLGRPDLARAVSERAYAGTYVESVALANLIQRIYVIAGGADRAQLQRALEETQARYRAALLDLGEVHNSITDEVSFFGYPADYIPFPSLDNGGVDRNAFEAVLQVVQSRVEPARNREQAAIQSAREFRTDAANFQAELTRITRTYEGQLAEICGTFEAPDGRIYPAIDRYAYLDPALASIGDPCGYAGNGQIHQAHGQIDLMRLANERVAVQMRNVLEQVEIERQRVSQYCGEVVQLRDHQWQGAQRRENLERRALEIQQQLEQKQRLMQFIGDTVQLAACEGPVGCVAAGIGIAAQTVAYIAQEEFIKDANGKAIIAQQERAKLEREDTEWVTLQMCDFARIDSNAQTRNILLSMAELEINSIEAEYQLRLAVSELVRLRQQSRRLQQELEESLQLQINAEAARNDPNVRIYRNDAIINADIAFQDLLREAWRLTLVFEYYTSQSYARRGDLFLVRTVSVGQENLENYVLELQNAFAAFEEQFGAPDVRVQVVSLRDDMLGIPRLGNDGRALTVDERARRLRERLRDPNLLDQSGYLTIPFRTRLGDLSPLTRNHKILYVEANIEGNDNGDFLGRLYLRQTGTGEIRTVDEASTYYRLPTRTAVLNPFFNGTREFGGSPEVYRSYRLRDLPLVNTAWELVFNNRDEAVNRDINLGALTDIKLYVFYTDFTSLD